MGWGKKREGRGGGTEIIGREKKILRTTRKCHIPEIKVSIESCLVIKVDHILFSTADQFYFLRDNQHSHFTSFRQIIESVSKQKLE